eukprot:GHVT01007884.1.p1 GENE.GHVT01007884.1~~GHVT01007884.1.p1  ORF type:complete len:105 (+),score=10.78 GHVT01007884.1:299-613(+)
MFILSHFCALLLFLFFLFGQLLARVQILIQERNPDLSGSKRYTIKPPQVVRVGSKKVAWINFKELCSMYVLLAIESKKKLKPLQTFKLEENERASRAEKKGPMF